MLKTLALASGVLMGGMVFLGPQPQPAAASPLSINLSHKAAPGDGLVQDVQHRRARGHRGGHRYDRHRHGPRYRHRRGDYRYYYGGYYYRTPWWLGAAAAAGVAGAIANSAARAAQGSSHVSWCQNRYRSYNPATDTYTGYDGRQHRCVSPY
jgi:hypothetical protein